MERSEDVAYHLKKATVVICNQPASKGGTLSGGVGTVIADRYVVTTKHVIEGHPNSYIWHPDDELMQSYRVARYWAVGENALIETDRPLPFEPYPVSMKDLTEIMKPGATIVYPGGAEFYSRIQPNTILMNVGTYNGPDHVRTMHVGFGRIAGGTSGGGIVSLEDRLLVGIVYGQYSKIEFLEQSIVFQDVSVLKDVIEHQSVTTSPVSEAGKTDLIDQYLPDIQNKYLSYAIYSLAGIGGLLIAKELIS
jgi:hypothetical protein